MQALIYPAWNTICPRCQRDLFAVGRGERFRPPETIHCPHCRIEYETVVSRGKRKLKEEQ